MECNIAMIGNDHWSCMHNLCTTHACYFHNLLLVYVQRCPTIWGFSYIHLHWLIMAIELCGVQFGLKSYAWFQNQMSMQREFDLKSQVWFRTKIARPEVQLSLYYIHFEITQFNSLNTKTTRTTKVAKFAKQWPFCLSFSCNVIG